MAFRSAQVFSVKKEDNSANFAFGRITNRRKQHNSICRGKNKHYATSYMMIYKAMSHVTLSHMRELSPTPTLVA
jgi:hypothetical protein